MSTPKVSYSDLESAFYSAEVHHCWVDRRTGAVIMYTDEAADIVREGDYEGLPKWQEQEVEEARMVLRAFGDSEEDGESDPVLAQALEDAVDLKRFIRIEQISSDEAFRFMEDFADNLKDGRAREALVGALRGAKPFRRFKDAVAGFPREREQWNEYQFQRTRQYIEEWAGENGLEIDFDNAP